jgi:hypothetical protein
MGSTRTPNGKVVTCSDCSWWAPMMVDDKRVATKEFEAHDCAQHPPVKNIGSSSRSN